MVGAYVQPKADGWWCRIEIVGGGYSVWSRGGVLIEAGHCPGAPDAILYAEAMVGTEWSRHSMRERKFFVFDMESPLAFGIRHEEVRRYINDLPEGCELAERLITLPLYPAEREGEVWAEYVTGLRWEGIVYKSDETPPGGYDGKRKVTDTFDLFVVEVAHSSSPYMTGMIKSLGLYEYTASGPVKVCNLGNMPAEVRRAVFAAPQRYIGKVVEVRGQCRTASGSIRHPRFVRWREDKAAGECVR